MPHRNPFFSLSTPLGLRPRLARPSRLCFAAAVFAIFLPAYLLISCSPAALAAAAGHGNDPDRIRIMSWNAQTFFDAREEGGEFSEFRGPRSPWNAERYAERLDRLAETILRAGAVMGMGPERGPEIVVLQEIENSRVLSDLSNRMGGTSPYPYGIFVSPPPGNAFACAILSRYVPLSVRSHTPYSPGVPLRPTVEAVFDTPAGPLTVFAVHWKSKLGEGDGERQAQDRLLRERLATIRRESPGMPFIVCGDFNCTAGEAAVLSEYSDLWDAAEGESPGSYWYDGSWERIDHMLWSQSLERGGEGAWSVRRGILLSGPPLTDDEGRPDRYELFSSRGYSDHLPLVMELRRNN